MTAARLVGDDLDVPLLGGGSAPHLNLDLAASAPALVEVRDAVEAFLPWYSSVHRGAGFKSQVATEAYESARDDVAAFVGARSDDVVVFTRTTTDSLNLLSHALPPGTTVVAFESEHHANLLPWRRHRVVHLPIPVGPDQAAPAVAEAVRAARRQGAAHVLVAVAGASNVTGELWPVAEVVQAAAAEGARTVVDAAQLAPHGPVDLMSWGADWVALSGHKLYAPYGAGVLAGRPDWLAVAEPMLRGGGAVRFVTLDEVAWADLPDRAEAGSPNVVGAVALGAACRALGRVGMDAIAAEERSLAVALDGALDDVPGVRRLRMWPDEAGAGRIAVSSFVVAGLHHSLVAAALSGEHGISVRDGCFCAHPLLLRLLECSTEAAEAIRTEMLHGSMASVPGAVRASLGLGATVADVTRLASALRTIVADGPRATYRFDDAHGAWVPDPDDRPRPELPGLRPLVGARGATEGCRT